MLDIHRIAVFLSAVEERSFSGAAKRLKMSQPAVSLQIQALEQQLGLELFYRTGRAVVLTEAGRALVPLARQMMGLSKHIEETMCALRGKLVGQLVIGCAATPAQYILPRLILLFKQRHPEVVIHMQTMDADAALQRVLDQEIHMGVVAYEPRHRDLSVREFMEDETVLLVPAGHPWADRPHVSLRELAEPCIMLVREHGHPPSDPVWRALESALGAPEKVQSIVDMGCTESAISAVEANMGVAILSKFAARLAEKRGRSRMVPFAEGPFKRTLYFFSNTQNPEVCARVGFCDFVHTPEAMALVEEWVA
jgi:DNA-binding transcriptional LysR family regulator